MNNVSYPTNSTPFVRCDKQVIAAETIVWLEGDYNYTYIHQYGQPPRLMARTLKGFEAQFASFIRIRRDAMVNPAHIRAVFRDEARPDWMKLLLSNGDVLTIARRRLAEVKQQVWQSA